MFYTLTEAEYEALLNSAKEAKAANEKRLQAFCTRVADELPVDYGRPDATNATKKPWGCILTLGSGYCDSCPAKVVCPHPGKRWSK